MRNVYFSRLVQERKNLAILLVLTLIFLFMFFCNYYSPMYLDDFAYIFKIEPNLQFHGSIESLVPNYLRVKNFWDVIISQYNHYFEFGGRTVAHVIAQTMLMEPFNGVFFDILNSVVFCAFLCLTAIQFDQRGKLYWHNIFITFGIYWTVFPAFGDANLWLTGSANYLWTTTLLIYILKIFRFETNISSKSFLWKAHFYIFSFLAGWCNENASLGLIIIAMMLTFINKEKYYFSLSIFFMILGYLLLIKAPGNYARGGSGVFSELFIFDVIWRRFIMCTRIIIYYYKYIFAFTLILALFGYLFSNKRKQILFYLLVYFFGFCITNYAMMAAPFYPPRTSNFAFILLIISFGGILNLFLNSSLTKIITCSIIVLISSSSFLHRSLTIYQQGTYARNVLSQLESKKNSEKNIVIKYALSISEDPSSIRYYRNDAFFDENPKDYVNSLYSHFLDVDSITVINE